MVKWCAPWAPWAPKRTAWEQYYTTVLPSLLLRFFRGLVFSRGFTTWEILSESLIQRIHHLGDSLRVSFPEDSPLGRFSRIFLFQKIHLLGGSLGVSFTEDSPLGRFSQSFFSGGFTTWAILSELLFQRIHHLGDSLGVSLPEDSPLGRFSRSFFCQRIHHLEIPT